jgi:hypothetical protein
MPADERPPEEYWHSPEALDEWFEAVKQKRVDRAQGVESIPDADDEDMTSNVLARELMED